MAVRTFIIPTPSGATPVATQRTTLDGQSYRFDFRWNVRTQLWQFDLYDSLENAVVLGRSVIPNWDLLQYVSSQNKPPGRLVAVRSDGTPPGLNDFDITPFYFVLEAS